MIRHTTLRPIIRQKQSGFALIITLGILMIAGVLLSSSVSTTRSTETTSGIAIQFNRAIEAAEGGAHYASQALIDSIGAQVFADESASEGVFQRGAVKDHWWRNNSPEGLHEVSDDLLLGVAAPPKYVYEKIGEYIADGGTGVVNMDMGAAAYGQRSMGAREYVLYRVESHGVGSQPEVERVVETMVIVTR